MAYYNKKNPKSAWVFVDQTPEENNRLQMIGEKYDRFNTILFNETHKAKIVESCMVRCNTKNDLFDKKSNGENSCLNNCMQGSISLIKSLNFIENEKKY